MSTITPNVSLATLVDSPLAKTRGFANLPNDEDLPNLIRLAHVMEASIQALKPHTLKVLSAYQTPRLTYAMGADPRDLNSKGLAFDFQTVGMDLHGAMHRLDEAGVPFDTLESHWRRTGLGWLHMTIPEAGIEPRRTLVKGVMRKGRVYL